MEWTAQQADALSKIAAWIKAGPRSPQVFRLFGFAGTGKSTLAREVEKMTGRVYYAAYTGKAASVMARKGCRGASTLHSLIYKPARDDATGRLHFRICPDSLLFNADLLVLDEASMVGAELARDVLSFGCKVLVLADPFQLPPPGDDTGAFTNGQPDAMLTDIRRQALENPIVAMSLALREGTPIKRGHYGESRVAALADYDVADFASADIRLVGRNKTRRKWNESIRSLLGRRGDPEAGDQVVCLRNDKDLGLMNGTLWTATKAVRTRYGSKIELDLSTADVGSYPSRVHCTAWSEPFTGATIEAEWRQRKLYQEFDFGYALTVHKAQGSQWDTVLVRNEAEVFGDDAARWLYTGITRAAERVRVVL